MSLDDDPESPIDLQRLVPLLPLLGRTLPRSPTMEDAPLSAALKCSHPGTRGSTASPNSSGWRACTGCANRGVTSPCRARRATATRAAITAMRLLALSGCEDVVVIPLIVPRCIPMDTTAEPPDELHPRFHRHSTVASASFPARFPAVGDGRHRQIPVQHAIRAVPVCRDGIDFRVPGHVIPLSGKRRASCTATGPARPTSCTAQR